ncbi:hypothetical protein BDF22DRAFT_652417 [Syncephalis plumigaleata]|nr:hypothetical protein BDF22DRAFT_652417 [Syncephalis plumigaleata]
MILSKAIWMPIVVLAAYSACLTSENSPYGVSAKPLPSQDHTTINMSGVFGNIPLPQPSLPSSSLIGQHGINNEAIQVLKERVCTCVQKAGNCALTFTKNYAPVFIGAVTAATVKQMTCNAVLEVFGTKFGGIINAGLPAVVGAATGKTLDAMINGKKAAMKRQDSMNGILNNDQTVTSPIEMTRKNI